MGSDTPSSTNHIITDHSSSLLCFPLQKGRRKRRMGEDEKLSKLGIKLLCHEAVPHTPGMFSIKFKPIYRYDHN